jgi:AcrR family transcriptional regulator
MPRKAQFTAEEIIQAAMQRIRANGLSGLTAAHVADQMGCSTMPIYSYFKNMRALEDEVVRRIWKLVMSYQAEPYTGDSWVDQAIGWVLFARDEENLFGCLTNNNNPELRLAMQVVHWQYLSDNLEGYRGFDGMDAELRERIRYAQALLTHGLATSPRTGFNKVIIEDDRILFGYLTTASQAIVKGYKQMPPVSEADRKHLAEKLKSIPGMKC